MSTAKTPARKAATKPASNPNDAIALLTNDHKEVKALFKEYDQLCKADAEDEEKHAVATQICQMLTVHATVEEEIFYPAARAVLGEDDSLIDEADVEHATVKDLIAQLEASHPGDDVLYDAKVKVLGEYVDHHVKEEEGEIFPKAKKGKLDTVAIGAEMAARKDELMAEIGAEA
ncbi:MAG: hemerythrin domain-containing protein [Pseudomonadota bacterium]